MSKFGYRLFIVCLLFLGGNVYGQDSATAIKVKAQASDNFIKLRWAPTDATGWSLLNKYGYTIVRHMILSGDELVRPIKKVVIKSNLKPAPLAKWSEKANKNDFAAIAAQAIYGNDFDVEAANSDILTLINKSQSFAQRFSFALVAADESWEVAELSALGITDASADPQEKYLYKIYGNIPVGNYEIDTGYVYIGIRDTAALPQAPILMSNFKDKVVELSWDVEELKLFYSSYVIERSLNGIEYNTLSDKGNILLGRENRQKSSEILKLDSLPLDAGKVFYRIRGKSSFGELGPHSNIVSGSHSPLFDIRPEIVSASITNNGEVLVEWDKEGEHKGSVEFYIERSGSAGGAYEILSATTYENEFIDRTPLPVGYYKVVAHSDNGEINKSFPYLLQLPDSLPPASPEQVIAMIDSVGNVTLFWTNNVEKDINGYRVYRSNFKSAEFSQVTRELLQDTVFNETVNMHTLTHELFYYVTALDHRFNESKSSEIIKVIRPDVIPPSPPVLKPLKMTDNRVRIEWINSSSRDVKEHLIYSADEKGIWALVKAVSIGAEEQSVWIDKSLTNSGMFEYKLAARDSSGNISNSTKPYTLRYNYKGVGHQISNLKGQIDRRDKQIRISWENPNVNVRGIMIYRSTNEEPMSLLTIIDALDDNYIDRNVSVSNTYSYGIKVIGVFSSGSQLVLSKTFSY